MIFGKINYILLIVGVVLVVAGFILMSGSGTTEVAFNPEIFNTTRTAIGPMTSLTGFIVVIVAILVKSKKN